MPKLKTNKAVKKRFKVTRWGKLLATGSHRRHLLTDRSPKQKRQARRNRRLAKMDEKRLKTLMPYL